MSSFSLFSDLQEEFRNELPNLSHITIVLPGQRAIHSLKKEIAALDHRPIISPRILTIQEWVQEISGLQPMDPFDLLLLFHGIYRRHFQDEAVRLDSFLSLAPKMLKDFDQIDRYLIPTEKLFESLEQWSSLEKWGVSEAEEQGKLIAQLGQTLSSLAELYHPLVGELKDRGCAYPGLIYRLACSRLEHYLKAKGHARRFLLVGFNALSKSEEHLFSRMLESGKADAYWDIDKAFLDDGVHDMGYFIRQYGNWDYYKDNPIKLWQPKAQTRPQIYVYGCDSSMQQAQVVTALFEQNRIGESQALIPCDEDETDLLLAHLMQALPVGTEVNISSGVPILADPAYQFLVQLLDLHDRDNRGWSLETLRRLTSVKLRGWGPKKEGATALEQLAKFARNSASAYFDREDISSKQTGPKGWMELFLPLRSTGSGYALALEELLKNIQGELHEPSLVFEEFLDFLQRTTKSGMLTDIGITSRSLLRLFQLALQGQRRYYLSAPESPIQVTGILETRNLCYPRLVFASVNEGILPLAKAQSSLIPQSIRQQFGLPGPREKDAIYAYHYYRLLSHSREAHVLYSDQQDELLGSERSRFVTQLLLDPPERFDVHEIDVVNPQPLRPPESLEVQKTPSLIKELRQICEKGISASALYAYLTDPRSFYLERILCLREPTDSFRELPPITFGNIIHNALEEAFEPLRSTIIEQDQLQSIKAGLEPLIQKHYFHQLGHLSDLEGSHYLNAKAIVRILEQFVDQEIRALSGPAYTLEELEKELSIPFRPGLRLKGIIDRVEKVGEQVRIVDYKTGSSFNPSSMKVPEPLHLIFEKVEKYKELFQLFFYALLLREQTGNKPVQLCIVSLVRNQGERHYAKLGERTAIPSELIDEFAAGLEGCLQEMLDPEKSLISSMHESE